MYRILVLAAASMLVIFTTSTIPMIGGNNYASAQEEFEPELKELLTNFMECDVQAFKEPIWDMSAIERYSCGVLMENSRAALKHILDAGTLSTYSQETQDLSNRAIGIIAPNIIPYNSTAPDPTTYTIQSTMDSWISNVCNYREGTCQVPYKATMSSTNNSSTLISANSTLTMSYKAEGGFIDGFHQILYDSQTKNISVGCPDIGQGTISYRRLSDVDEQILKQVITDNNFFEIPRAYSGIGACGGCGASRLAITLDNRSEIFYETGAWGGPHNVSNIVNSLLELCKCQAYLNTPSPGPVDSIEKELIHRGVG